MEQNLPLDAENGHHRGQAAGNHHPPDGRGTGRKRGAESTEPNGVGRCDEQHQKRRA